LPDRTGGVIRWVPQTDLAAVFAVPVDATLLPMSPERKDEALDLLKPLVLLRHKFGELGDVLAQQGHR
jgi:hypothetical protein